MRETVSPWIRNSNFTLYLFKYFCNPVLQVGLFLVRRSSLHCSYTPFIFCHGTALLWNRVFIAATDAIDFYAHCTAQILEISGKSLLPVLTALGGIREKNIKRKCQGWPWSDFHFDLLFWTGGKEPCWLLSGSALVCCVSLAVTLPLPSNFHLVFFPYSKMCAANFVPRHSLPTQGRSQGSSLADWSNRPGL